jgi:two-component system C4-dicarboxylate transport sensor histidine kinase DctB
LDLLLRSRRSRLILGLVGLFLIPLIIWQTAAFSREAALNTLAAEGQQRLTIYRSNLQSELEKYEFLPVSLSRIDDLVRLLIKPDDREIGEWVNHRLEEINALAKADTTYLMASDGKTLASSNWKSDHSFVGKNFSFRPYFQQAMAGRSGRYFALGTTSNEPGYYLSHPVKAAGQTLGAVVVKVSVKRLEQDWAASNDLVMVVDADGIIVISSKNNWKFRALLPLDETRRAELIKSRKYNNATLTPMRINGRKPYGSNAEIISLTDKITDQNSMKTASYFLQSMKMPGTSWTLYHLSSMRAVHQTVIYTVLIVTFALIITALTMLYMVQRRLGLKGRLELQRRAQEVLREANDSLEQRVQERTADLKTAQDGLLQASKLAALGQLAAGITHELNNPLAAIRSYSDNAKVLLERERFDDAAENLTQISDLTGRMAEITQQLRAFSRKTVGRLDAVSIAEAMAQALSLLSKGGKLNGITIQNKIEGSPVRIRGNLVRLEQVLINLISNAVDAMQGSPQRLLEISLKEEERKVVLSVRDTGKGFGDGELENLFDPFFTTKEAGKGLGLGLSISSRIISDFGGAMRAENHRDGGAVFRVELLKQTPEEMQTNRDVAE